MNFGQLLRQVAGHGGGACDFTEDEAYPLFCAMLDGGVPDLELGALLTAITIKGESPAELAGFHRALHDRLYPLRAPATRARPLVIPTYGGTRTEHNLLPLLGLLLRRLGIPVLFHGTLETNGTVACVYILRELGILPSATRAKAQTELDQDLLAFVPAAALCPGLASLLAVGNRLGTRNSAHTVVQLMEPFQGHGVRLISASTAEDLDRLAAVLATSGDADLLLRSTEGEPFADPRRRPRIEWLDHGERRMLFGEEPSPVRRLAGLPASIDAHATAGWIRQALNGEMPIPHPLVNELACCLFATGYADDMNQAKAIAAVETGSLGSVGRRHRRHVTTNRLPTR